MALASAAFESENTMYWAPVSFRTSKVFSTWYMMKTSALAPNTVSSDGLVRIPSGPYSPCGRAKNRCANRAWR